MLENNQNRLSPAVCLMEIRHLHYRCIPCRTFAFLHFLLEVTHRLIQSFTRFFIHSLVHSFIIHSFAGSSLHSFIHSSTHYFSLIITLFYHYSINYLFHLMPSGGLQETQTSYFHPHIPSFNICHKCFKRSFFN